MRAPIARSVVGQLEPVDELDRRHHRHARHPGDVEAADGDREARLLEPVAVAGRARLERHVLLDPLLLVRRVGLAVAPVEAGDDALEREHVAALAVHPVAVADVQLLAARALQEQVAVLLGQIRPGRVEVDLVAVGDRLDHLRVEVRVDHRPRHERALRDREARIGHDQVGIDLALGAEPGAARAGAVGRVEREDARRELRQRDAVVGAGELLGVRHRRAVDDRRPRPAPRPAAGPSRPSRSGACAARASSPAGRPPPRSSAAPACRGRSAPRAAAAARRP